MDTLTLPGSTQIRTVLVGAGRVTAALGQPGEQAVCRVSSRHRAAAFVDAKPLPGALAS